MLIGSNIYLANVLNYTWMYRLPLSVFNYYCSISESQWLQCNTNPVSRLSMFQLQAEHGHAAGLIDLLFKGRVICFTAALPYKQVVNKHF